MAKTYTNEYFLKFKSGMMPDLNNLKTLTGRGRVWKESLIKTNLMGWF